MSENSIVVVTEQSLVPAAEVTQVTVVPKNLSFTVIHGYLRGEHACPYELHATGCKDLRSKQAKHLFNYEVLAGNPDEALDIVVDDSQGTTKRGDYWVQPCCQLKRMKAAGRA